MKPQDRRTIFFMDKKQTMNVFQRMLQPTQSLAHFLPSPRFTGGMQQRCANCLPYRRINPLSKPERKVVRSDIWKEGHPVSSRGLSEVCVFLSWSSLLRLSTWTRWLLASISGIVCASCLAEPKSPVRRLKQSTVVCCFAFVIMCRMRPW